MLFLIAQIVFYGTRGDVFGLGFDCQSGVVVFKKSL